VKKIIWIHLFSLAFLTIVFVRGAQAEGADLKAMGVSGPVTVIRDGKSMLIQSGDALQSEDRVTTAGDSRLDIIKAGGWGYRLLQSSECVIHTDESKTEIEMLQGSVIFKVVPTQGRNLTVRTPVVVAAVRGTQFWGQVTPAGASHNSIFAVREGDVELTVLKSGDQMMLKAGQAVDVLGEQGTATTREAKPAELDAIGQIEDLDLK
jgi:ferric-dicitrate binding protein FerR (iron transport regulator)